MKMTLELLKVEDVARITRLSLPMIYKLIAKGKLAHVRIGRSLRVDSADLDEFIRQRRQMGTK
jgi:putative molybdopterin biosynthesis protein